jgi:hypothetical protein
MFQIVSYFVLNRLVNLKVIHIGGIYDKLMFKIILDCPCPKYDLYDTIHNISVYNKAKAEAKCSVGSLLWVIGCNVAVAYCCYRIYSPVDSIEILYLPVVVENRRIGGC